MSDLERRRACVRARPRRSNKENGPFSRAAGFSQLHRTTEFLVLDERQLPAQRFLFVPGLLESRDFVGDRHDQSGIYHRFADQTFPAEFRLASSLFRQHRFGGHAARKPVDRRFLAPPWRSARRMRFPRVSSDLERQLNRAKLVVCLRNLDGLARLIDKERHLATKERRVLCLKMNMILFFFFFIVEEYRCRYRTKQMSVK